MSSELYYPGRAIIDLEAIRGNVSAIVDRAPGPAVMAVVKADGYGHGLIPAARAAVAGGATWLGAAKLDEALGLRAAGLTTRILSWLFSPGAPLREALEADIDVSVSAGWALDEVAQAARASNNPARVHVKVDTGLSRNGLRPEGLVDLLERAMTLQREGILDVVGIWSHLALADEPGHPMNTRQRDTFDDAVRLAEELGCRIEVRHLANSAATLTNPKLHYDLVRPGIAIYGISPVPDLANPGEFGLRAAMTLEASLAGVKRVPAGTGVSYGQTFTVTEDTSLGLVPLGYSDGIPRHASGTGPDPAGGPAHLGGPIRVGGGNAARTVGVAGRICMDQFVVDLGPNATDGAGDWVVLFGDGRLGLPTVEDWARAADTISYEITTRISSRIPRVFLPFDGQA